MDVKILGDNLKFKLRVSAIIINNGNLLVNRYGENSYCLPGGYVNLGETSEEAIIRELKEETGLNFKIVKYGGVAENFFTNLRNQKTHGIDFYYFVDLDDKKKTLGDLDMNYVEKDNHAVIKHHYYWIPLNDINSYNILPEIIKDKRFLKGEMFHYIITK